MGKQKTIWLRVNLEKKCRIKRKWHKNDLWQVSSVLRTMLNERKREECERQRETENKKIFLNRNDENCIISFSEIEFMFTLKHKQMNGDFICKSEYWKWVQKNYENIFFSVIFPFFICKMLSHYHRMAQKNKRHRWHFNRLNVDNGKCLIILMIYVKTIEKKKNTSRKFTSQTGFCFAFFPSLFDFCFVFVLHLRPNGHQSQQAIVKSS